MKPEVKVVSKSDQKTPKSPLQIKKILVPIEDADCSRKAVQYAVAFAKQFNASITLLNALRIDYVGGEFSVDYNRLETELRTSGEEMLGQLVTHDVRGQAPCDTKIQVGDPASTIVEIAEDMDADLIIISTHGRTGFSHFLLGSTTEHVIRHAPCPVLTVRKNEHDFIEA